MRQLRKGADFIRTVESAQFGRLGDADDFGLGMVLEPEAVHLCADQFRGQFAVRGGDGQQTAAHHPLYGTAFIHIDVGGFRTDDSLVGAGHCINAERVGSCSVEHQKRFGCFAEMLFE